MMFKTVPFHRSFINIGMPEILWPHVCWLSKRTFTSPRFYGCFNLIILYACHTHAHRVNDFPTAFALVEIDRSGDCIKHNQTLKFGHIAIFSLLAYHILCACQTHTGQVVVSIKIRLIVIVYLCWITKLHHSF